MRYWLRSYVMTLRWQAIRLRSVLPLFAVVQAALAVGVIVGFGFLMPSVDQTSALFLATGGPTLALITIGVGIAPQLIAQSRTDGTDAFDRSLPVPRLAMLAAGVTGWVLAAIPGIVLSLVVAALRYDLDLAVSPLVVPAFLLVSVTATSVGYGLGYGLSPVAVGVVTQALVFFVLLFSPVSFPEDRLPEWLGAVHTALPVRYMAETVRQTLLARGHGIDVTSFAVLVAWAVAGLWLAHRAMTRRI